MQKLATKGLLSRGDVMEPVVIGRSDLGEAYGVAPSGVGAGLLDPVSAISPRGRVLLGAGQPVVFIVPLTAGDVRGVVEQIEAAASEDRKSVV